MHRRPPTDVWRLQNSGERRNLTTGLHAASGCTHALTETELAAVRAISISPLFLPIGSGVSWLPQQFEGMLPLVADEAGNAPEDTERLDGTGGFHFAHVGGLPAELVENP
jgi:hypothetical protein